MTGWLVVCAAALVTSAWLVISGWRQPAPSVAEAIGRLRRRPDTPPDTTPGATADPTVDPAMVIGVAITDRVATPASWLRPLRLIDRSPELHLGFLTLAGIAGAVVPILVLGSLQWLGVLSLGAWVPAGAAVITGVTAVFVTHADAMARAEQVEVDLRHQLGAYLDMVTMLLAGNSGYEGALEQAARAGDGQLFTELSRRMREVGATGQSAVVALERVADDYGLVELEQVAATTALSAAEGAPVARSLGAKCATLRSTLAAEQEAAVRIRTDKVTPPLVGMALLFMALIIYPALDLT